MPWRADGVASRHRGGTKPLDLEIECLAGFKSRTLLLSLFFSLEPGPFPRANVDKSIGPSSAVIFGGWTGVCSCVSS